MLRLLHLSRAVGSLSITANYAEGEISAFVQRRGSYLKSPLVNPQRFNTNQFSFDLTDEVHQLPVGYYEVVVMAGDCECARFPAYIPTCHVTRPGTCVSAVPVNLPPRTCTPETVECPDEKASDCVDPTQCGGIDLGAIPPIRLPDALITLPSDETDDDQPTD